MQCSECGRANVSSRPWFQLFWINTQKSESWNGISVFTCLRKLDTILHAFTLLPFYKQSTGFQFSTILSLFFFLIGTILTSSEVISSWFWFALPWWLVMLNVFSCTHWSFVGLLLSSSAHFLNQVICLYAIELWKSLYSFGAQPCIRYIVCKYFLLFYKLSLHSIDEYLCCA